MDLNQLNVLRYITVLCTPIAMMTRANTYIMLHACFMTVNWLLRSITHSKIKARNRNKTQKYLVIIQYCEIKKKIYFIQKLLATLG